MNILSIDWDFFFPDVQQFDWQMNEDMFLYYELIWPLRWGNSALFDQNTKANEIMHPRSSHRTFWDSIQSKIKKRATLIIVDTHSEMYNVFNEYPGSLTIWNFDQHHDCGYGRSKELDCGNWAQLLYSNSKIQYHQVYPDWRKTIKEEPNPPGWAEIHHESDPLELPKFDFVFICRSSPWTPSWADRLWLRFIHWFKDNRELCWKNKMSVPYPLKERTFNWKEAIHQNRAIAKLKEKSYAVLPD